MNEEIKKILVAFDFSDSSLNALHTAISLCNKLRAEMMILHVRDDILKFAGINTITVESVYKNSSDILSAVETVIYNRTKIVPGIIEEEGHVQEIILRTAIRLQSDLIVMGKHGASGTRDGFIGSTTQGLIKYAPCPILVIPGAQKWESFKKPIFPVRPILTAFRHYDIIKNLLEPSATMEVVGIFRPGGLNDRQNLDELIKAMKTKLDHDKIDVNTVWTSDISIPQNILTMANNSNSDLLVIPPAIDISRKKFYIGTNMHHLINNSTIPVLAINKINVYTTNGSAFIL